VSNITEAKDRLPSFLNLEDTSNISKMIELMFTELDNLELLYQEIVDNFDIDKATLNGLDKIGANLNLVRNGLTDTDYRNALKGQQAINQADGTLGKIIEILQIQLGILDPTDIELTELGNANIFVEVPIDVALLSTFDYYKSLVDKITSAGIGSQVSVKGTFRLGTIDGEVDPNKGLGNNLETTGGKLGGII